MFWSASPWNTYSLPVRLAGSPVHSSFAPRIPKSTPALWSSRAVEIVTFLLRSSNEPEQPTHMRYSAVTPNRPDARGAMVGLRTDLTREELARVAHDGVLGGLLNGLRALEASGSVVDGRLLLVGGGARSAAYRQRLADLAERPVHVPGNDEAVAVGAAVQAAAVQSGSSIDSFRDGWGLSSTTITEPRAEAHAAEIRARYDDASQFDDGLCRPLLPGS